MENILLRGCTLKNTDYAYGVAVYVGLETKIFLNAKKPPRKISAVMRMMNIMLILVLVFQIMVVVAFASANLGWSKQNKENVGYIGSAVKSQNWFVQVLTYWVAYSNMIPISLYVAIEILKINLGKLIDMDV